MVRIRTITNNHPDCLLPAPLAISHAIIRGNADTALQPHRMTP